MNIEWELFKGQGEPRKVKFPDPPPWREFPKKLAEAQAYRPGGDDVLMVNVALNLRRPLLLEGPPGSGKSSLARAVARELQLGSLLVWPINSRTTYRDGLYLFDAVGRLNDLTPGDTPETRAARIDKYVKLGPLGTALASKTGPRVLLIDELDKSDGDLPNDLLHVLENGWFTIPELERVTELRQTVEVPVDLGEDGDPFPPVPITGGVVRVESFPVIIITSNQERDFPPAFLRRCVRHTMEDPAIRLPEIVTAHLGKAKADGAADLIGEFVAQVNAGESLAIDQLLNAVFLLAGDREITDEQRQKIRDTVLRDLKQA